MATYIVELYLAGEGALSDATRRARDAATRLAREGRRVRYLRSLLLTADETCFLLVDAESAEDAGLLSERAGLPYERVVEAQELTPAEEER